MTNKFVRPAFQKESFTCPRCGVVSHQEWNQLFCLGDESRFEESLRGKAARCEHCNCFSVWLQGEMIFPESTPAPAPHEDMPDDVKRDYNEAAQVVRKSGKAAAALLRLALQRLMPHLGQQGKNINNDIKELVSKGLPSEVQQSLDSLRVIGNEAVHPGEIDFEDDSEIAISLFELMNFIVEDRISRPKKISAIFSGLPESKRKGIEDRDKKSP